MPLPPPAAIADESQQKPCHHRARHKHRAIVDGDEDRSANHFNDQPDGSQWCQNGEDAQGRRQDQAQSPEHFADAAEVNQRLWQWGEEPCEKSRPRQSVRRNQFDEAAVQKEEGKTDLNNPEDSRHARFAPQRRAVSAARLLMAQCMFHVSSPFLEKPDLSGLRMIVMKGTSLLVSQIDSMDRARQHIRLMTHRFDFPCHFSDTSPRENVTEMVNWVKIRTKVSVDSLGVRIFTPIFRG